MSVCLYVNVWMGDEIESYYGKISMRQAMLLYSVQLFLCDTMPVNSSVCLSFCKCSYLWIGHVFYISAVVSVCQYACPFFCLSICLNVHVRTDGKTNWIFFSVLAAVSTFHCVLSLRPSV